MFQLDDDLKRFFDVLTKRLARFDLLLEPEKTKYFVFGRFSKDRRVNNEKRIPVIKFLVFSIYSYFNNKKRFVIEFKTESKMLSRSLQKLKEKLRIIRHIPLACTS